MNQSTKQQTTAPHIGDILKAHFKTKRTHQAALARAVGKSEHTIIKYKKAPSIHTKILWQLCHALQHNLFMDLALRLPTHYSTNTNQHQANQELIATLQRRIEILEAEKAVLLELKK